MIFKEDIMRVLSRLFVGVVVISFMALTGSQKEVQAYEYSYAYGYVAASHVFKDDAGDYCGVSQSIYPYERSGPGLQSIDDGVNYSMDSFGAIFNRYGTASADVKSYANASTGEIKTYNHAHNHGIGPDYRMNGPLKLAWGSSGWGASMSKGYYYNVIHVEPGTSGLSEGDDVQLDLGIALDGSIVLENDTNANVFMRTQIANITDVDVDLMNDDILPWRADNFVGGDTGYYDFIHDVELDIILEIIEASLDTDFSIASDNTINYDSGNHPVSVKIGDWLLLESYLLSGVSLPNHDDFDSIGATADFLNTMSSGVLPSEGYEGILLAKKDFCGSQVPIPGSAWLLVSGLLGLTGVRRRKKD